MNENQIQPILYGKFDNKFDFQLLITHRLDIPWPKILYPMVRNDPAQ